MFQKCDIKQLKMPRAVVNFLFQYFISKPRQFKNFGKKRKHICSYISIGIKLAVIGPEILLLINLICWFYNIETGIIPTYEINN